jgi:hypothetical protein
MMKLSKFFIISLVALFSLSVRLGGDLFVPGYEVPVQERDSFRSPTQRYLDFNPRQKVVAKLKKQSIQLRQQSFYDHLIKQEEEGHIGYHAASHQFRVFQDIIRGVLEEILELEFKRDFYFFRLPGDASVHNYTDSQTFLSFFYPVNDNEPMQRDQLISVNFTLFSNYNQKYECTPVFFEKAISYKPPDFKDKIALLFEFAGMSPEHIGDLFELGKMIEHPDAGTMFQLFDLSYQNPSAYYAYQMLDEAGYACIKKGVPLYPQTQLSELYNGVSGSHFLDQYRLVVNYRTILNPYSALTIRRYDLNSRAVVKKYEQNMRALIRSIPYDPIKAQLYKKHLLEMWKI